MALGEMMWLSLSEMEVMNVAGNPQFGIIKAYWQDN